MTGVGVDFPRPAKASGGRGPRGKREVRRLRARAEGVHRASRTYVLPRMGQEPWRVPQPGRSVQPPPRPVPVFEPETEPEAEPAAGEAEAEAEASTVRRRTRRSSARGAARAAGAAA